MASMSWRAFLTCAACLACTSRAAASSFSILVCSSTVMTFVSRGGGRSLTGGVGNSVASRCGVPSGSPPAQVGIESTIVLEQPAAVSARHIAITNLATMVACPANGVPLVSPAQANEPHSMARARRRRTIRSSGYQQVKARVSAFMRLRSRQEGRPPSG